MSAADIATANTYAEINTWMCAEIATTWNGIKTLTDFTGEADDYDIFLDIQFNPSTITAIANGNDVLMNVLLKERA